MNPEIFREYDVRGLNEELDDNTVRGIGIAFAEMVMASKGKIRGGQNSKCKVVVGKDNREQSPRISKALIGAITGMGAEVISIGEATTPELYFAVHWLDADGGINVTGSHNPPKYNGFKILVGKEAIYGQQIQGLAKRAMEIEKAGAKTGTRNRGVVGTVTEKGIDDVYLSEIAKRVRVKRKVKVVVDAGNGMASELGPRLLKMLGCETRELFCKKDSTFPNHIPDPSMEANVTDLKALVVESGAEMGIAFDGDADRIGIVDEKGRLIYGDRLLGMLAKKALHDSPRAKIIFEVKCSQGLGEYIKALGGKPIMWKTGHSLIKAKMREEGAILAGEMSGHMFFAKEWYGVDDALLACAKAVEIVSESGKKVSEIAGEMPNYATSPEYRIDFPDSEKFAFVEKAKAYFKKADGVEEVIEVDGARVVFGEGWGLIRASNTQPKLILRFEGRTKPGLEKVKSRFLEGIKEFSGRELTLESANA
ncbi:Phosphoglucomutase/phosphomannomutase [uncultured archaeon]|nr:Phosphoglucomutase/phosphomannomutase [uncultured archaeon]